MKKLKLHEDILPRVAQADADDSRIRRNCLIKFVQIRQE